jgi:hypothetical protein
MLKAVFALMMVMLLGSCRKFEDFRESDPSAQSEGYFIKKTIKRGDLDKILLLPSRPVKNISDSYRTDKFLFIAEYGEGVHIFKDPESASPEPLYFLSVPALRNFTVKDDHIICNNGDDLIAFKVKGLDFLDQFKPEKADSVMYAPGNLGFVNRRKNVFKFPDYPEARNVYFECPTDTTGYILEWEKRKITTKLSCYR